MANLFTNLVVGFQDAFGNGNYTNGAALIRQAAEGTITGSNFKIGFTALGGSNSIKSRVYLQVPKQYLKKEGKFGLLSDGNGWGGIYFPVTPSIKQDSKANWQASNVQHSNYAVQSYVNSDVGAITVSGQFPVQTQQEAIYWVVTVNALRALTKMRTGIDTVPGSPPPVCRFNAYGADIYENVPVVVSSFSVDLPSDVDYVTGYNFENLQNKVPTLSTISITLLPVYSRREMANFGVDKFVLGNLDGQGYL